MRIGNRGSELCKQGCACKRHSVTRTEEWGQNISQAKKGHTNSLKGTVMNDTCKKHEAGLCGHFRGRRSLSFLITGLNRDYPGVNVKRSAKIRKGRIAHLETHASTCKCMGRKRFSALSQTMISLFLSEFPVVEEEKRFGRFFVDAYLPPPYHLAFEADGTYWHSKRKDFDKKRDAHLLEQFSLPVIRLSEEEIKLARKENV